MEGKVIDEQFLDDFLEWYKKSKDEKNIKQYISRSNLFNLYVIIRPTLKDIRITTRNDIIDECEDISKEQFYKIIENEVIDFDKILRRNHKALLLRIMEDVDLIRVFKSVTVVNALMYMSMDPIFNTLMKVYVYYINNMKYRNIMYIIRMNNEMNKKEIIKKNRDIKVLIIRAVCICLIVEAILIIMSKNL
jgi:hypothetical protein